MFDRQWINNRKGLFFLFVVTLILLCNIQEAQATSPINYAYVHRLMVEENQLWVAYDWRIADPSERNDEWQPTTATSSDGVNWHNAPAREVSAWGTGRLPQTQCQPDNTQLCYLIDSNAQFEAIIARSVDGGRNWTTEIAISRERSEFRRRISTLRFTLNGPNLTPADLEFFAPPGVAYQPMVALGSAGILTRDNTGQWQNLTVDWTQEWPASQAEWQQLSLVNSALGAELTMALLAVWLLASLQIIFILIRRRHFLPGATTTFKIIGCIGIPPIIVIFLAIPLYFITNSPVIAILLILFAGIIWAWILLKNNGLIPEQSRLPHFLTFLNLTSLIVALTPLYLWALGIIPQLTPARTIALDVALFFATLVLWQSWRKCNLVNNRPVTKHSQVAFP